MKIKPQPKQIPDTPGDHPTRIELAMQDTIGIKPQARARPADFVAFALTLLRPENRYDKVPGPLWSGLLKKFTNWSQLLSCSCNSTRLGYSQFH